VRAALVGGSVSHGCADRYSDIELGIFWSTVPSDDERRATIARASGVLTQFSAYDARQEGAAEAYTLRGVVIEARHRLVTTVAQFLGDVLERHDTAVPKQQLLAVIHHAIPIAGTTLVRQWQERTARYPDGLAEAVVRENVRFIPAQIQTMLAERDDCLRLYESFCATEQAILAVLMGLNRIYHPGFKWVDRTITVMPVAPDNLPARLKQPFRSDPRAGVAQLHTLVEETFALVDMHLPAVDTAALRAQFRQRRPVWEHAPIGLRPDDD